MNASSRSSEISREMAAETVGVILSGGKSRRMGRDKAFLMVGEEPAILRIARSLSSVFREVVISVGNPQKYSPLGLPIICDIFYEAGPLAGIHAALSYLGKDIFVVPCDKPLITSDLIKSVLDVALPNRITIVTDELNPYPLFGLYPRVILPHLHSYLKGGGRRVFGFLESPEIRPFVSVANVPGMEHLLKDMNDPEDYIEILTAIGSPEESKGWGGGSGDEGHKRKICEP